MAISIRNAGLNDAAQLYEMIRDLAAYEQAEDCVKVTEAKLQQQLGAVTPPFECAICEVDGESAAFALYFYAYSTWEGARTLYLEDLYVRPKFRGAGIGAEMMSFLARIAQEQRCGRLEWSVLDWNEPAIGFYEKLGAKPVSGWTRYRLDAQSIETFLDMSDNPQPANSIA